MGSIHNVTPSTKALIIKAAEGQTANLLEIQDNLGNTLYYIDKDGNPSTGQSGVVGPVSSTDEAIARFDGTTGAKIQDSKIIIDDNGSINIPTGQYYKKNGTALTYSDVDAASNSHNHDADYSAINHNHDATYAPIAKGVTNGDSHDHSGGDGAQIDHVDLSNVGTNTHAEIDTHLAASAPHAGHALSSHNHSATEITSGTLDGDRLPALSSTKKGGVPATGTPSGKYLKDSGEWDTPTGSGGDVVGPASATDNAIARYDSTTGKLIQDSLASVNDTGSVNIPSGQTFNIDGSPHNHDSDYAPISKGVTNGDTHDHSGGDGAQIDHGGLAGLSDDDHTQYLTNIRHDTTDRHTLGTVVPHDSHTLLSDIGTKTHTQIDTHIDAVAPHSGHALSTHYHAGTDITSGTIDGDRLPSLSTTKRGGVPATGTPSGKFLKDDDSWDTPAGGGSGDVVGPASATDNGIARYDGTSGKLIQDSLVTIADTTGAILINGHQSISDPGASPTGKFLKDSGEWDSPTYSGTYIGDVDFVIYESGGTYYSKNCRTGSIAYSSSIFSTVVNNTITSFAGGKGHIKIMPGTYYLSAQINLASNITLQASEATYVYTTDHPSFHMIYGSSVQNIIIKGGIWDINQPTSGEYYQIELSGCAYFRLQDLYLQSDAADDSAYPTGIACIGCSQGFIHNDHIYNGCIAFTCDGALLTSRKNIISLNRIISPPKQGIKLYTDDANAIFDNFVIAENYIEYSYNDGICVYMTNASATCHAISITGNTLFDCCTEPVYQDQPAIGTSIGPAPHGNSYSVSITGNTIYDSNKNHGRGIGCYGGYYNIISSNAIYGSRMNGISLTYTNGKNLVIGNTICPGASATKGTGGGGIWMSGTENTLIANNIIELLNADASASCIYMASCNHCMITGNMFGAKGASAYHADIDASCNKNVFMGNKTFDNAALSWNDLGTLDKFEHNWGNWTS